MTGCRPGGEPDPPPVDMTDPELWRWRARHSGTYQRGAWVAAGALRLLEAERRATARRTLDDPETQPTTTEKEH